MSPENPRPFGPENRKTNDNADAGTNPADQQGHIKNPPYDKTSIHEALNDEKVTVSIDTGQLNQVASGEYWSERPPAQELPTEKKSRKGLVIGGIATAAGLAVVGGAIGFNAMANNNEAETPTQPTNEVPVEPTAPVEPTEAPVEPTAPSPTDIPLESFTPTPNETEGNGDTIKSMSLEITQNPEQLGKDFTSSLESIYRYGFDSSIQKYEESLGALFSEEVAEQTSHEAVNELEKILQPSYEEKPSMVEFVERIRQTNLTNTYLHLITTPGLVENTTERLMIDQNFSKIEVLDGSTDEDKMLVNIVGYSTPRNLDKTNIRNQEQYSLIGEGSDWQAKLELEKSPDGSNWLISDGEITATPRN